ncbi:hypothetical protein BOTBODRAFT_66652 [Botryobasidium botryosum FD-172 SS1]|uniref:Uncharacterized protein n=1 Tax=Botryobasidium botryosum (strain FD-172 SS1) TaxID=930990 RepID=A0A067MQ49_BOTB1|nr:hypothetical protein BOTBODRAFT_66652 [Botryobasidium botryosum FD-172 SS1]
MTIAQRDQFKDLRKHIRKLEREDGPQNFAALEDQIQRAYSALPPDADPPVFVHAFVARAILTPPYNWDMTPLLIQVLGRINAQCLLYQKQAANILAWDEHYVALRGDKDPSGCLTENQKAAVRRMKLGLFTGTQSIRDVFLCFSSEIRVHHLIEMVLNQNTSIPSLEDYFPADHFERHLYTFHMSPEEIAGVQREREGLAAALDRVETYQQQREALWEAANPHQSIELLSQDEGYRSAVRKMFRGTVEWEKIARNVNYWVKRTEMMVQAFEDVFIETD